MGTAFTRLKPGALNLVAAYGGFGADEVSAG